VILQNVINRHHGHKNTLVNSSTTNIRNKHFKIKQSSSAKLLNFHCLPEIKSQKTNTADREPFHQHFPLKWCLSRFVYSPFVRLSAAFPWTQVSEVILRAELPFYRGSSLKTRVPLKRDLLLLEGLQSAGQFSRLKSEADLGGLHSLICAL